MKNAKSSLRVLLCFALIFVVVLSMASCDIGGAFGMIADGNFKGAWGSLTGKHEYTSVVTPPTCLEKGYTTYTCAKCGDTYVDDYVDPAHTLVTHAKKDPTCKEIGYEAYESCTACGYTTYKAIPKADHTYTTKITRFPTPCSNGVKSTMCTVCGIHEDTYLDVVSFTLPSVHDALKSFVGNNVIEINAKDTDVILIKEIVSDEDIECYKNALALKVGNLTVDGEGEKLYAYLSLDLGLLSYDSAEDDAEPTFSRQLVIDVIIDGDQVSLAITEDGQTNEGSGDLSEIFYTALASCYGMTYEQFVEATYVGGKIAECAPFVQSIIGTITTLGSTEINPILPDIMALISENVVIIEGNKYTVDLAGFAKVIETLQGKTVTDIIDARYGVGTFDRVESFFLSLPTMKVRDVVDIAVKFSEQSGVALDDVYALINYLIYSATGEDFNIESEVISNYDKTVLGILMESSGYNQDKISERAVEITEDLQYFFDTVKDLDVDQLYNLAVFGNANYSSGDGSIFRITDSLSAYAEMLGESSVCEMIVDDNGNVIAFNVFVDGAFNISYGTDAEGYNDVYIEFNYASDYYKFSIDVNDEDATFVYSVNSNDIIFAEICKNELGEISSANVTVNQVVYISNVVLDSTGENYVVERVEMLEKIADIVYTNDGESISIVITTDDGTVSVFATVENSCEDKTVTGTITSSLDDKESYEGSFTYVEDINGVITDLVIDLDMITYDYTDVMSDVEGEGFIRVYDETPKRYDILDLTYTSDAEGNFEILVDVNYVTYYDGASAVEDGADVEFAVTTVDNGDGRFDDVLVLEVKFYDGESYKLVYTVSYTEYTVIVEDLDVGYEIPVTYVTAMKVELYVDGELDFTVEASSVETENGGRHFTLNVEGLEYVHIDTEYELTETPDGPDYSGDYENPTDYDGSPVTIVFYHTMGSNLSSVLDKYIAEFNEMYPNITIVHERIGGYDDVRDQIKNEIAVGFQPNIAYCYGDHVALYNTAGAVVPLDGFIESNSLGFTSDELENFIDGFYDEGAMFGDGSMYMLPLSKSTEILYYNKTFFETYGLQVPTTWDEMEEVCELIKEIDPYSTPLGYDSEANWFITMCEQYGSPYTSADDHYLFDNETNRAFVARFREWYQNGWVTTQEIYGGYMSNLLVSQQCYMVIGSSAGASYYNTGSFEVGMSAVPQVDPYNPKAIQQGPSLCIFKQADYQEVAASWLFVKFLTSDPAFQAEFSMASGYMPVTEAVLDIPLYQAFLDSSDIRAQALRTALEQRDAFFASPAFNGSAKARDVVGVLMQYCFTVVTDTVEETIKKAFEDAIEECWWYE